MSFLQLVLITIAMILLLGLGPIGIVIDVIWGVWLVNNYKK